MTSPSASAIDASPLDDRRLHVLCAGAATLVVTYGAAATLGASSVALNLILTVAVGIVAVLGWGAFARAPTPIRPMCSWLAPAATCWFVGTIVWDYYFIAEGR
jgi:hypothetical protein